MKHLEKLKETLCEELDKFAKSGDVTVNSLEKIHKLTDTIKNIDKIMALEESEGYSETRGRMGTYMHGSSYDDDMMYSERRGRGRNARRDSMGRYSSEGGSYEGGSSYERGGQGGYSRDEATDWMMRELGSMMEDADPKQREALKKCMRELERD